MRETDSTAAPSTKNHRDFLAIWISALSRFIDRLNESKPLLMAGGSLFEAERRRYLTAGEHVPKVALDHPEVLEQITHDFPRAGSDITLAFTYNSHRVKMRITDQEQVGEPC